MVIVTWSDFTLTADAGHAGSPGVCAGISAICQAAEQSLTQHWSNGQRHAVVMTAVWALEDIARQHPLALRLVRSE